MSGVLSLSRELDAHRRSTSPVLPSSVLLAVAALLAAVAARPLAAQPGPRLSLEAVATTPTTVQQGQTGLVVHMTVTNTGDEAAAITTAGLTFGMQQQWTQLHPATAPAARHYHAMAYDPERRRTVLFGGHDFGLANETWEWDGTNWAERTPATRPYDRSLHAMAYDTARRQVVLFGGSYGGDETWVWDGTNWVLKSPVSRPSP
ncbi:MAG: hypothetical protein HY814_03175 [Candidatus Riflebacteria bacterium]|nr:hypothetical protein [Candidatus Riflebacteria bacterium]